MNLTKTKIFAALVVAGLSMPVARAEDGYPAVKFTGFASLVGGAIVNKADPGLSPDPTLTGPIYIADWTNWGVYSKTPSLSPESKVGAQAVVSLSDKFRLTGQVVVRGVDDKVDLTWAYASYDVAPGWEFQVGRKRIPLYYYSDFQDIGYALPWVSTPPDVYGWEVTNYDGASVRYKTAVGGAAVTSSVFGGSETVKDSRYMRSFGYSAADVTWKRIRGADFEVSKDWLTLRGVYIQANPSMVDRLDSTNDYRQKMTAYGLAANADFGGLFFVSEFARNNRSQAGFRYDAPSYTVGLGYRLGRWTPLLNWSEYRELTTDPGYTPLSFRHATFTLRRDLTSGSSLKVQVDRYLEYNGSVYSTDSTVLRVAYDIVF